jgi:hypothetical protein
MIFLSTYIMFVYVVLTWAKSRQDWDGRTELNVIETWYGDQTLVWRSFLI